MKGFITIFLAMLISGISCNAQTSRSYMEQEVMTQTAYGPISEVPQHSGTWVEWSMAGDSITMMDGSEWKLTKSLDGLVHYRYTGTSGQIQQYTRLHEAIFNKDFSKMKIRYEFGPMGMPVQMVGIYVCLGDGKQLAEDWINIPDEE